MIKLEVLQQQIDELKTELAQRTTPKPNETTIIQLQAQIELLTRRQIRIVDLLEGLARHLQTPTA